MFQQIANTISTFSVGGWRLSLVFIFVTIVLSKILQILVIELIPRAFNYSTLELDKDVLNMLSLPMYVTIAASGISLSLAPIGLSQEVYFFSNSILTTIALLLWSRSVLKIGDRFIEKILSDRYDKNVVPIAENIWTVFIIIVVAIMILRIWGINLTPILASAGIIGVSLGFAARDAISNLFGSVALYFDGTYTKGEFIELEDGISGRVRDISIRSTLLETRSGDNVTIPNSVLNKSRVTNKSNPTPERRLDVTVDVSYDTDPSEVKSILEDNIQAIDIVSDTNDVKVNLIKFGDSALIFKIFFWITDERQKYEAKDKVNRKIYQTLDSNEIDIPYPKRDIIEDKSN